VPLPVKVPCGVVVATILPVESTASTVLVIFRMVELWKVVVAVKVWAPVQVTEEAAVTKPGFTKV